MPGREVRKVERRRQARRRVSEEPAPSPATWPSPWTPASPTGRAGRPSSSGVWIIGAWASVLSP